MPETTPEWFKSSYSGANGSCVEARHHAEGAVEIRDSKDPDGPTCTFSRCAWAAFVAEVKGGGFPAA
jgi:Domain of unknown function (DUF397)